MIDLGNSGSCLPRLTGGRLHSLDCASSAQFVQLSHHYDRYAIRLSHREEMVGVCSFLDCFWGFPQSLFEEGWVIIVGVQGWHENQLIC